MTHYHQEEFYSFDFFSAVNLGCSETIYGLGRKSDVSKRNGQGWTPLMYACNNGQIEIVNFLIKQGGSVEHHRGQSTKTPLMLAVASGDLDTVRAVCDTCDLEATDAKGWTALFYAVFYGRENCADYLLRLGANPLAVDLTGKTPIDLAVKSEMESMMALLHRGGLYDVTASPSGGVGTEATPPNTLPIPIERGTPKRKISILRGQLRKYSPNLSKAVASQKENVTPGTPFRTPPVTPKRELIPTPKLARISPNCTEENSGTPFKTPPGTPSKEYVSVSKLVRITPNSRKENAGTPFRTAVASRVARPLLTPRHDLKPQDTGKSNGPPSVLNFLTDLGLEKYWPVFRDEEVDFETFITFGEDNLREIGIKLYGPRRKIAVALNEFRTIHGASSRLLKSSFWLNT